jgi:hypothetical protein
MQRMCSSVSLKDGVATGRIATDEMVSWKLRVENKWRYPDALPDLQHSRSEGGREREFTGS